MGNTAAASLRVVQQEEHSEVTSVLEEEAGHWGVRGATPSPVLLRPQNVPPQRTQWSDTNCLQRETHKCLGIGTCTCPQAAIRAQGRRLWEGGPGEQGATVSLRHHVEFLNLTLFSLGKTFFSPEKTHCGFSLTVVLYNRRLQGKVSPFSHKTRK